MPARRAAVTRRTVSDLHVPPAGPESIFDARRLEWLAVGESPLADASDRHTVRGRPGWPKPVPQLTSRQVEIQDDWQRYFHEVYPTRYGAVARFNHTYPLRSVSTGADILDIGAGIGGHLQYEELGSQYVALELRPEMAAQLARLHPQVRTVVGDVQQRIPAADGSFDRVLAIHVLEHLPDLPAALSEVHRVLRPGGLLSVVIPCEGGLGYALGRRLTTQRTFERRYGISYLPFIQAEHMNGPAEVMGELRRWFCIEHRAFFPFLIPNIHLNLCIGLTCRRA
jgi:SAM-dependent methyltransferase